jgi:hypothetical protein
MILVSKTLETFRHVLSLGKEVIFVTLDNRAAYHAKEMTRLPRTLYILLFIRLRVQVPVYHIEIDDDRLGGNFTWPITVLFNSIFLVPLSKVPIGGGLCYHV